MTARVSLIVGAMLLASEAARAQATLTFSRPVPLRAGAVTLTVTFSEPPSNPPTHPPNITIERPGTGNDVSADPMVRASGAVFYYEYTVRPQTFSSTWRDGTAMVAVTNPAVALIGNVFVIDTVAPSVSRVQFGSPAALYAASAFDVTVTFSEPLGRPPVISIPGGIETASNNDTPATSMQPGAGALEWVFHRTPFAGGGVDDGTFIMVVTAHDLAGNSFSGVPLGGAFVVDTIAPAAPVTTIADNASPALDTISGTAEPESTIRIYADSAGGTPIATAAAGESGSFGPVAVGDDRALVYYVSATDVVGNESLRAVASPDPAGPVAQVRFGAGPAARAGPLDITATFEQPLAGPPTLFITRSGSTVSSSMRSLEAGAFTSRYFVEPADGVEKTDLPLRVVVRATGVTGNRASTAVTLALSTSLDFTIPLRAGLNAISLPARPASPLTASALCRQTGVGFVARCVEGPGGRSVFGVFVPGGANDFILDAGQGYLVFAPRRGELALPGAIAWPASAARRELLPGPNLVGVTTALADRVSPVSTGPVEVATAGALARATTSRLVVTTADGPAIFAAASSELGTTMPVFAGRGYIVVPAVRTTVELPLPVP